MPSTMPVLPPNDNGCPDDLTNTAGRSLLCNAKRTSDIAPLRSELCQEQTSCTAQKQLFDHLVGAGQERFRESSRALLSRGHGAASKYPVYFCGHDEVVLM
jgi:hypothetical protein